MKKLITLLSLGLALGHSTEAQRLHKLPTQQEIDFRMTHPRTGAQFANKSTAATSEMPADVRFPGEFEESQAVSLAWPYDYVPPAWIPDVTSEYAELWGQLADAIQKEAKVIIRVDAFADSISIKNFMVTRGTPLANYSFSELVGDAWWARDFGPLGFYYSDKDSLGFLDIHYYPGRDNDDAYAGFLADQMGYKNVKTNLHAEGGNFMVDGFRNAFHSSVITTVNTYTSQTYPGWSVPQINDSVKYYWGADSVLVTTRLQCDGGTGHIDMYMKLMDEQTFAIMEYPSVVLANDKSIISNVINTLSTRKSTYNRPYRIFKMPMPTQDDGDTSKFCGTIDGDARTFVNGLMINKTYIMPAFANTTDGNIAQNAAAVESFKKILPGYNIVPIDSRGLTILGGAIHCITMQIPAENPITFWHPAITDFQAFQNSYRIIAKITNKSGIANAECKWRLKGANTWITLPLADSAGYKVADLVNNFNPYDTVEYFINATSNNGKTMSKPMVAPDGFYSFYFTWPANVNTLDPDRNFALNPVPNPSNGDFFIPISLEHPRNVRAVVTDVLGKKIAETSFGKMTIGINRLDFNLTSQAAGMYFIQLIADDVLLSTKKVVKE